MAQAQLEVAATELEGRGVLTLTSMIGPFILQYKTIGSDTAFGKGGG